MSNGAPSKEESARLDKFEETLKNLSGILMDNLNINRENVRFLDENRIKSWRWQAKDGGLNFKTKRSWRPNAGTVLPPNTSVLIFHGTPKPHEVKDTWVKENWK